ncbi:beta-propeller domain-containing protein [Candidatus Bathyarchaeota archaeon]|nr:beta-propeller domain-containing protein [Candidatus Bathyarchaeota archaeon]
MERKIKKQTVIYGLTAILLAASLGALCFNFGLYTSQFRVAALPSSASPTAFLTSFSSYEALKDFLATGSRSWVGQYYYAMSADAFSRESSTNGKLSIESYSYSSTNVQVAGVDESDIVKTDGEYIYVISGNFIEIIKAYPPETAGIVSKISLGDSSPIGIYVNGDRLVVLGRKNFATYTPSPLYYRASYYGYYNDEPKTFVNIYDIHDRTYPILLRDLTVDGDYSDSRMIGDYVYFNAYKPAYLLDNTVNLPEFSSNGQVKEITPSEIYYRNDSDSYYQFTTFVAMNLQNTTEAPTYLTVMLGQMSTMYVSLNNLYISLPDMDGNTTIYRIHVEAGNMTCEANGNVPGRELNQFSMDEDGDHFRIATTRWANGAIQNNVYVLDMNLSIVGKLENLASGENLHSARFMGSRCYLVTFQTVDPLFVIDLSVPSNPSVLGNLTIPGYSDYLHPYDENHLIGIGKDTVTEGGSFALYQGVKISLFDVSNVTNPQQIANYIIGDRGSSSLVFDDHKAFLFDRAMHLLAIPVTVAKIDPAQYPSGIPPSAYGTQVWQGCYVFNVSLTQGFLFKGGVTHLGSGANVGNDDYWVQRSLYIENVLYTVSNKRIKLNNLNDLSFIGEIELP